MSVFEEILASHLFTLTMRVAARPVPDKDEEDLHRMIIAGKPLFIT